MAGFVNKVGSKGYGTVRLRWITAYCPPQIWRIFNLLALFLCGLYSAEGVLGAQSVENPYPLFKHDAQHTGRSTFLGAQKA
ncbi:MAG TPA: hypothetical protein VJZ02_03045, partial [Candidatus Brocadiales bacterium]|nr:hypothetical protein [Candidatus Brocadiales bacterium]